MCLQADPVVALKVSGDQIVGMDELADRDGLRSKADELVELTDRLSGRDSADRKLMAGGNVRGCRETQSVKRLACGEWLEGDNDIVRASELESNVAQTILAFTKIAGASSQIGVSGTTTLYSN
jgi:hypothetical protein